MRKKLIVLAFEKAIKIRINKGENKPSLINVAEDLSDFVHAYSGFKLGERSYRDYKSEAEKIIDKEEDIKIKQIKVINGLCHYLGYEDYEEFVVNNEKSIKNKSVNEIKKKNRIVKSKPFWIKIIISISISLGCLAILFFYLNKPRFMVWQNDHYVEVSFDVSKYELSQLKRYKKERVLDFKRISPKCDSTIFFNNDKTENLWYGKNSKGEMEYFTSLGKHPETGKTLKAITTYIVEKYICLDE
jgi:hypothetical protein